MMFLAWLLGEDVKGIGEVLVALEQFFDCGTGRHVVRFKNVERCLIARNFKEMKLKAIKAMESEE